MGKLFVKKTKHFNKKNNSTFCSKKTNNKKLCYRFNERIGEKVFQQLKINVNKQCTKALHLRKEYHAKTSVH